MDNSITNCNGYKDSGFWTGKKLHSPLLWLWAQCEREHSSWRSYRGSCLTSWSSLVLFSTEYLGLARVLIWLHVAPVLSPGIIACPAALRSGVARAVSRADTTTERNHAAWKWNDNTGKLETRSDIVLDSNIIGTVVSQLLVHVLMGSWYSRLWTCRPSYRIRRTLIFTHSTR